MPLALSADARPHADLATRLHLHLGAFIGADTGSFDVADHADADAPALGAQLRLLFAEEMLVADQLERLVEDRLVVPPVVLERLEVLLDDPLIVRKGARRGEGRPG